MFLYFDVQVILTKVLENVQQIVWVTAAMVAISNPLGYFWPLKPVEVLFYLFNQSQAEDSIQGV